jgi:multiple sugar transport system permease protein
VLTDPAFQQAARNTVYFVVVGVPLTMVISLAIAIALNTGITRAAAFFRVGYYMPVVTSIVAVAVVFRFLLQPDTGLVLGWFGIQGPNWLESTTWAMPSLIAMATWRSMGTLVVIFLAGLQSVPQQLHEAAALDGAGAWQRLRNVTLPTEEPFVMTQGGPLGSTKSVAYAVYDQFGFGNYGYAAAMSYVLFVAIVLLTALQFRFLGDREDRPRRRRRGPVGPDGEPTDRAEAAVAARTVRAMGGAR